MPLPPNLHCGAAGWSYPHWNGVVFPKIKPRNFHGLSFLAQYFDAVEINTSFYQPIRPELARLWLHKVEENPKFLFTAKLHRSFTHERSLNTDFAAQFKEGLFAMLRARKLGCLLMQFPWTFRFTDENRTFLIQLRRLFHEFPLVAEFRHSSWMWEEALGTLIDYRVGFCNIDQAAYTKAMPPSSFLTSDIGYVRMHGRNPQDWDRELRRTENSAAPHNYLYSTAELREWQTRIEEIRQHAARTFVIANNEIGGKSVVNALQLSAMLGDGRRLAPADLMLKYRHELGEFEGTEAVQTMLFERAVA
ncbi:MAG: DUF72 domain-containing protein [Acidobacteriaceae bacterium]|nr:DUF72 domain-containing protein [Acidobacteriaceae bacterium]